VLGNRLGDGAGCIRLGGADAALLRSVPEYDQRGASQAAEGYMASNGSPHDGAAARPQADVMGQLAQLRQAGLTIKGGSGHTRITGGVQTGVRKCLFLELEDDAILSLLRHVEDEIELHGTAAVVLELQGGSAQGLGIGTAGSGNLDL